MGRRTKAMAIAISSAFLIGITSIGYTGTVEVGSNKTNKILW
ncbi:MAG: hypothetical protein ACRC3Y_14880 [Romboutsia sp.]